MEKTTLIFTDYVSLDTLGFAQLSDANYHEKIIAEKKIITNFFLDTLDFAVPLPFTKVAKFNWKKCAHDFGIYWDFIISYNREFIENLEEENFELYALFWDWINKCQTALVENEELLLTSCKIEYEKFS